MRHGSPPTPTVRSSYGMASRGTWSTSYEPEAVVEGPRHGGQVRLRRWARGASADAAHRGRRGARCGIAAVRYRDPERYGCPARPGGGAHRPQARAADAAEGRRHAGGRHGRDDLSRQGRARAGAAARGPQGATAAGGLEVPREGRDGGLPCAETAAGVRRREVAEIG